MAQTITWDEIKNDPNARRIGKDGFVFLKSVYGEDSTVCEAARISYGKGTKTINDDRNLIRYLINHRHTSPLEQCSATFIFKLPLFVMGQIVRHRTAKLNQYSGRYSEMPEEYFIPDEWRKQSISNKQGGEESIQYEPETFYNNIAEEIAFKEYKRRIDAGVSRELSRTCLPQSSMTLCVWQCDLHNLFNFLRLRMDSHAQKEIRDYANAMYELLKPKFPLCFEAFEDYDLHAVKFSRVEMEFIRSTFKDIDHHVDDSQYDTANLIQKYCPELSKREIEEFKTKLGVS